jgi:hypothetical protein
MNKKIALLLFVIIALVITGCNTSSKSSEMTTPEVRYVVTDSMQSVTYDDMGNVIDDPIEGEPFYGQDAQVTTLLPSYTDNGDGTVTDNNTNLMWQQDPPKNKLTYDQAVEYVENLELGGYTDWRLPTIEESFTLAMMDGKLLADDTENSQPYIDTDYFNFYYDERKSYTGSYWTSTTTVQMEELGDTGETMEKNYGFNWADGHLKSYADGYTLDGNSTGFSIPAGVRAVRGQENVIGNNDFQDNNDGTITDNATQLMWSQSDAEIGMDWEDALEYAQQSELAGYSDWRLPTPKELQTLVEYGKEASPAIDTDYFTLHIDDSYVWTSTTSGDFPQMAVYIAFGHGWGLEVKEGDNSTVTVDDFEDVHGPGAIRADYKSGTAPALSQEFYEMISGEEYPGAEWKEGNYVLSGEVVTDKDQDQDIDEFDLSFSENAADYIVIYNRVMLVRDVK